jgi:hypothetical protein
MSFAFNIYHEREIATLKRISFSPAAIPISRVRPAAAFPDQCVPHSLVPIAVNIEMGHKYNNFHLSCLPEPKIWMLLV